MRILNGTTASSSTRIEPLRPFKQTASFATFKFLSRVAWNGTHTGALNGIPPTGRRFRSEAVIIDHVTNGQIKERWEVSDMLGMMQQLGVIPAPGA